MPEDALWPAMPVLATEPVRLIAISLKSTPATVGAIPLTLATGPL